MNTNKPYNGQEGSEQVRQELAALSPLLASIAKPPVEMPPNSYFEALEDATVLAAAPKVSTLPPAGRRFKLMPIAASLAVAASIAIAIIFWPIAPIENREPMALNTLTDAELVQLALQDDELLEERILDDEALVQQLGTNDAFQYLAPVVEGNQEYNALLLDLIDDETMLEDW